MTKMMDLNKMGLMLLNDTERIEVDGGTTDFAYDAGTGVRAFYKYVTKGWGGFLAVIGEWYVQQ